MASPVSGPPCSDDEEDDLGRKVRGRPRLTDTDRARRRLESRKKYDGRRVYLGEAHGAWVWRRERGGGGEPWSDARLAAYLLALERHGKPLETIQRTEKHRKGCDDGGSSDDSSSSTAPVEQILEICSQPSHVVDSLFAHSSESPSEAKEQGTTEDTVVCVPMQVESGTEEFFEGVAQDELGHVVTTGCSSQVIIIAGPGYEALAAEGIQVDVTAESSGDEGTCTALEAVSAYTQTEPDDREWEQKTEEESFFTLQREQGAETVVQGPESDIHLSDDTSQGQVEPGPVEEQDYRTDVAPLVRKEPEKRRSKPTRVLDADGLQEMFHCPFEGCPQVYTALSSFQNHVNLVHRKGKTKVCPEPGCGKRFYLSNHLRRHMIIHTGVREFICETCGKSFKRKNHLEVHRRTHTGETPLQCEVCGYQCRQRASLNWHMKKHRADIQFSFSCEYCGKLFEKRDSVKFHILKSHPEEYNT
ncbi:zinc finger protein 653 isoform 2-T2 [Discoglossus pictus]